MKKIVTNLLAILLFAVSSFASAQNFGVVKNQGATPGYNLFTTFRGSDVWLIDNDGYYINHWPELDDFGSGATTFLTERGTLVRALAVGPTPGPFGAGAGIGGLIREYDWDGTVVWQYAVDSISGWSHHATIQLPNGNFLISAYSQEDCVGATICPTTGPDAGTFQSEKLIEIRPNYKKGTGKVVWEWNLVDHLLPIGAEPYDYPHLWGGFGTGGGPGDPVFTPNINHIDYNKQLNQILISCNSCDELWIIEKRPTTKKAAKNSGGQYGKGGGFIYRFGNRFNYGQGIAFDSQIDLQHGARFIKKKDEFGWKIKKRDAQHDNIILYNNGFSAAGQAYSEIEPLRKKNGKYKLVDGAYQPEQVTWSYGTLASNFMGSVQVLPGGNTIINAGVGGTGPTPPPGFPVGGATAIELDKYGNEVWRFVNPVYSNNPGGTAGLNPANRSPNQVIGADCDVVANWNNGRNGPTNWMFRMYRYAENFKGFKRKDMSPKTLLTDMGVCL